jgi:hypothetical protein
MSSSASAILASYPELPVWLTPPQLAQLLNVTTRTLERHRSEGRNAIPFVKHGRRIYYPRDVVLDYFNRHIVTSTAEAKRIARVA